MQLRRFWILSLALSVVPAALVHADDAKPADPTFVVRLKAFDGLIADAKYIAELAGKAEEAKQIDGILKNLPVKNGLAGTGLDTKRPFLVYGVVTPDAVSSYGALMLPLADENAFQSFLGDMLANFGVTITKGNDGIHSVAIPNAPVEAYFTVANGYAYITAKDKSTLQAANIIAPAKLTGAGDSALASAMVRLDQIPDMLKQMALQQLDIRAAEVKDQKQPGETPAQTTLRLAAVDYIFRQIRNIVKDGGQLDAKIDVDRSKADVSFDASFSGKPGTNLAKDIAQLGERTSLFAASLQGALQFGLNLSVPEELRSAGMNVVKESFEQGLKNEKDEKKRELARKIFDAFAPVIKAGQLDLGLGVHGPDSAGHVTFAFGMKVPDGKALERLVKDDILPTIPPDKRKVLTPDAATIAGISLHKITPQEPDAISPSDRKMYGDQPSALVGFDANRVVGALGADPAVAIKSVIENKGAKAAPVSLTMSVAKMAPLVHPDQADAIRGVAKKTFNDAPAGSDLFTVRLEGGPALRFKVTMKAMGITFLSKVQELAH